MRWEAVVDCRWLFPRQEEPIYGLALVRLVELLQGQHRFRNTGSRPID